MRILAPISGVFVPQSIRRGGEYKDIQAGDELPPGMVLGDIHDTSGLVVEAAVNQADAHLLRRGMQSTIRAEAYSGLVLPARLTRIGSMAQSAGVRRDMSGTCHCNSPSSVTMLAYSRISRWRRTFNWMPSQMWCSFPVKLSIRRSQAMIMSLFVPGKAGGNGK
jgi:hypothetical protein